MKWKFVFNARRAFESGGIPIAILDATKHGYEFFVYNRYVYFIHDGKALNTLLTEADLF